MRERGMIGAVALAAAASMVFVSTSSAKELTAETVETKRGVNGIALTGTAGSNDATALQEDDNDLVIRVPAPQTIAATPSCNQDSAQQITCPAGTYQGVGFKGFDGADSFTGKKSLRLITNLYGGDNRDDLDGGQRYDLINGGRGRDNCHGGQGPETIKNCE